MTDNEQPRTVTKRPSVYRHEALAYAVAVEKAHARAGNGFDADRTVRVAETFEAYLEGPRPEHPGDSKPDEAEVPKLQTRLSDAAWAANIDRQGGA